MKLLSSPSKLAHFAGLLVLWLSFYHRYFVLINIINHGAYWCMLVDKSKTDETMMKESQIIVAAQQGPLPTTQAQVEITTC